VFVVKDILDLQQIKNGKFRKQITKFSIKDAVSEVTSILEMKSKAQCLTVTTTFEDFPEVMNGIQNFKICTDRGRLQQVFMNLLTNSVKFTPKNGKIHINCKLSRPRITGGFGEIEVSVQDSGLGISKEDQKKLF